MPLDDLADVLAGGPHDAGQQHGRDNAIHLCGLTKESQESTYRVPVSTTRSCRAACVWHTARSLRRGWHHTGDEQFTFPPLPGDRYPSSRHALPDLPPHRRLPARQPERGPDRALPPGPPRSAGPPFPATGHRDQHHPPMPPRVSAGPGPPCRRAEPEDASGDGAWPITGQGPRVYPPDSSGRRCGPGRDGSESGRSDVRSAPLVTGDSVAASHRAQPLPIWSAGGSRDPGEAVAAELVTLVPAAWDLRLRNRPAAALTSRLSKGKGTRRETEGEPEPGNGRRDRTGERRTKGNQRKADEGEQPGGQTGNRRKARRGNRRTCDEAPERPVRVRGFGAACVYDAAGAACVYDAAGRVLAGLRELRIVVHHPSGGQRPSVSRAPPDAALRPAPAPSAVC